jgi:hypothetical protein
MSVGQLTDQTHDDQGELWEQRWTVAPSKPQSLAYLPDSVPLIGQVSSEERPELISPFTLARLVPKRRALPRIATIPPKMDPRYRFGGSRKREQRLALLEKQPLCPCGVEMTPGMYKGEARRYGVIAEISGHTLLVCHGCKTRHGNGHNPEWWARAEKENRPPMNPGQGSTWAIGCITIEIVGSESGSGNAA